MATEKRQVKYIIIFLFLLNFVAGISFINEGLFHCDAVFLAQAVENTYKTGRLYPAFNGRYGSVILNSILYLPFYLFGHNADFTVRLSGILFHSLSVVALFLFIRELFADLIHALYGSLLISFVPFYFSVNTYGKEHGASIFFLILSFYLLARGLRQGSLFQVYLASFLLGISVSIRESILLSTPLFILLYLDPEISVRPLKIIFPKARFKPSLLIAAFAPFIGILCLLSFAYLGKIIYQTLFLESNDIVSFLGIFSPVLRIAFRDLMVSASPLLLFLFLLGAIVMFQRRDLFLAMFFSLWFLLILYFGNTNGYCPRHLDVVAIAVCVFASYELSWLRAKYKMAVLIILACLVSGMFAYLYPMLEFRHRYNGEKQFALFVKEKTEDNAIIIAMDDQPFVEYYGKRRVLGHPFGNPKRMPAFRETLENYLKNKIPVYLIESGFSYDKYGAFGKMLFEKFNVVFVADKLAEDFHRAELRFQTYQEKLFKIQLQNG